MGWKTKYISPVALACLLLLGSNGFAQTEADAAYHINQLKNGVLLVRLQSKKDIIRKMRQLKWHKTAAETEREERADHLGTMAAFKQHFDFCPVYFFASGQSDYVRYGMYKKMEFLNDSLKPIKQDIAEFMPVYTAEMGDVFFQAFGSHMKGVAVMDRDFTVLQEPFPAVVSKQDAFLGMAKSKPELVRLLNEQLHKYYQNQSKSLSSSN